MKRTERRHLKQNEVVTWVARAIDLFERRRGPVLGGAALVLAGLVAWGGVTAWQARSNAAASAILAEAMGIMNATVVPPAPPVQEAALDERAAPGADPGAGTAGAPTSSDAAAPPVPPPPGSYPSERAKQEAALPKFLAAAEAQANGFVGLGARYRAATILAELGRLDEAAEQYRTVRASSRAGIYADMARLGLAELDAMRGDYDAAIATWLEVSADPEAGVPTDGALMQLAEVYVMAADEPDAIKTYTRVVNEFPTSQYATSAQQEIDRLKEQAVAPPHP